MHFMYEWMCMYALIIFIKNIMLFVFNQTLTEVDSYLTAYAILITSTSYIIKNCYNYK